VAGWVLYFKGTNKKAKCSKDQVKRFKKNSPCLSGFSDLLFERALPGFDAQTWKFPEPGEPCVKHIKGVKASQKLNFIVFLGGGECCCSEQFPRFL
jgi:hypothetical protein